MLHQSSCHIFDSREKLLRSKDTRKMACNLMDRTFYENKIITTVSRHFHIEKNINWSFLLNIDIYWGSRDLANCTFPNFAVSVPVHLHLNTKA